MKQNIPKDCLSCANSFSEEGKEFDILHCVLHDKVVEDDECCKDYTR